MASPATEAIQSRAEAVPSGPVAQLRRAWRLLVAVLHIADALLTIPFLPILNRCGLRTLTIIRWWFSVALKVMGFKVTVSGEAPPRTTLIVSNHVSWVDIMLLGSITETVFVAKEEIRDWPLVGLLATTAHTVYLPRGTANVATIIGSVLKGRLEQGQTVAVFPQATTEVQLLPERFFARLFAPSAEGGFPVQPIAIHYRPANEAEAREAHHPAAPFIGEEISMFKHLLNLLKVKEIEVRVTLCPLIEPAEGVSRSDLAKQAKASVCRALQTDAETG